MLILWLQESSVVEAWDTRFSLLGRFKCFNVFCHSVDNLSKKKKKNQAGVHVQSELCTKSATACMISTANQTAQEKCTRAHGDGDHHIISPRRRAAGT